MSLPTSPAWWEKPVRFAVRRVLSLATNVYFSNIEVRGLKNLQAASTKTGAIFAGNHPSGLVDPMVIMSAVDLPMSSIAKHSLFSTPIISIFVRAMRAVPVMQPYDPGLPPDKQATAEERKTMNDQMFSTVQQRLVDEGFNIVIFPEGTCHSTPQIKQMRMGTARMTLQIASQGGPRIPIIPVGLSYSVPSGAAFRAKVLVDFGKPILPTDDMMVNYTSGDKEQALLVEEKLMKRVERHLRHVTIRVPDWTLLLSEFCIKENRVPPKYTLIEEDENQDQDQDQDTKINSNNTQQNVFYISENKNKTKHRGGAERLRQKIDAVTAHAEIAAANKEGMHKNKQQVSVQIGETNNATIDTSNLLFHSRIESESSNDARKRIQAKKNLLQYVPKLPQVLKRQAARNALFSMQGFEPAPRDWEFINLMHLARHIYKPEGKQVTLAQYASLTRNFMNVVLDRLADPKVKQLWKELKEYRHALDELVSKPSEESAKRARMEHCS